MSVNAMKGTQWCLYVPVMRIERWDLLNGGKFQRQRNRIDCKTWKMLGVKWILNGFINKEHKCS